MTLDYDEFHLPEPVRPCLHAARGAAPRPTSWPRR